MRLANPVTYIHPDMPSILIQYGRLDPLVPVQQSICFVQELKKWLARIRVGLSRPPHNWRNVVCFGPTSAAEKLN